MENIVPDGLDESESSGSRRDIETLDQGFYDRLSVVLGERIKQCGNKVPVITGTLKSLLSNRHLFNIFILSRILRARAWLPTKANWPWLH